MAAARNRVNLHDRKWLFVLGLALTASALSARESAAQPPPDFGFNFITIGDVGNAAYDGGMFGNHTGRGSVGYEYRIAQTEVTSAQWLEFVNVYSPLFGDPYNFGFLRSSGIRVKGGGGGPNGPAYELNPFLANAADLPVVGVSWRNAARYVNWLHNGKAPTLEAIETGVYDIATFTMNENNTFNDQHTRSPGSKYWIPSLDEWIKAAHWDPNKNGPGQGDWWLFSHTSDTAPISGPPGAGQTTGGWLDPVVPGGELFVPLRSYPDVRSPWGLLDVSGGTSEWTEEVLFPDFNRFRVTEGSWGGDSLFESADSIDSHHAGLPQLGTDFGLRVASVIPAPLTIAPLISFGVLGITQRRRSVARYWGRFLLVPNSQCLSSPTLRCQLPVDPAPGRPGPVPHHSTTSNPDP